MIKKIGLIIINSISLVIFFITLFIYIDQGNNELARWAFNYQIGLTIINLILVVILLIFNNLIISNNNLFVDQNNNLKLSSSITFYLLNIINLGMIIYALIALTCKLPAF